VAVNLHRHNNSNKGLKMKKMFASLVLLVTLTTTAFAGVQVFSGSSNLGVVGQVACSTGLTCTKNGNKVTMVSSPALTGTSLALSSTLDAAGNFSVATNKFNVTAASGNTAIAGTANVVGNFSVATNKFNVTAASGNTAVAGTFDSAGNFSVATNKMTVAAASGNTAIAGTLGVTGAVTHTGGIADGGGLMKNFMGWRPSALTSGTSTTPSATVVYLTQIYVPFNVTLTGIYVNNGATVGTNKWIAALFNSAGTALANSALAGVTTSGADGYQQLPFTGTVAVTGPGVYWIGLYANGTTDRFRSVPAVGQYAGYAGSISAQTFGTVATITPPTTFTADVGPVAFTY
jgi:hypothetical protein